MANPFIPKPLFPNVPDLPGVPDLLRAFAQLGTPDFTPDPPVEVENQAPVPDFPIIEPVWGVFDADGNDVFEPDSLIDLQFRNDSRVSQFPVQDGAFASYNKVANAFNLGIRMTKGGTVDDRAAFLDLCETVILDTEFYTIVTPEKTYTNCNIESYQYRREQTNGANLIIVDMSFIEIREVSAQYTQVVLQPEKPAGASPKDNGKTQPAKAPQSVLKSLVKKPAYNEEPTDVTSLYAAGA